MQGIEPGPFPNLQRSFSFGYQNGTVPFRELLATAPPTADNKCTLIEPPHLSSGRLSIRLVLRELAAPLAEISEDDRHSDEEARVTRNAEQETKLTRLKPAIDVHSDATQD